MAEQETYDALMERYAALEQSTPRPVCPIEQHGHTELELTILNDDENDGKMYIAWVCPWMGCSTEIKAE